MTNANYLTGQIDDLSEKLEQSIPQVYHKLQAKNVINRDKKSDDKFEKATIDSCKITMEMLHGSMAQHIKNRLFNVRPK